MPADEEDSLFLPEDHEYLATQHEVDNLSASPERPQEQLNVFAGGKSRKARQTLDQAAIDPTKTPKLLNARKRGILGSRSRNADGVTAPAVRPKVFVVSQQKQLPQQSLSQGDQLLPERLESALKCAVGSRRKR